MEHLELLGLTYGAAKEEVKKAYFKKMKEYPPEIYEEEFIKLTEAYEYLMKEPTDINNNTIINNSEVEINEMFSDIITIIQNKEEFYILIGKLSELCKLINIDNFSYINDLALSIISLLRQENYIQESLLIALTMGRGFEAIGLECLCKAYKELQLVLILNRS